MQKIYSLNRQKRKKIKSGTMEQDQWLEQMRNEQKHAQKESEFLALLILILILLGAHDPAAMLSFGKPKKTVTKSRSTTTKASSKPFVLLIVAATAQNLEIEWFQNIVVCVCQRTRICSAQHKSGHVFARGNLLFAHIRVPSNSFDRFPRAFRNSILAVLKQTEHTSKPQRMW